MGTAERYIDNYADLIDSIGGVWAGDWQNKGECRFSDVDPNLFSSGNKTKIKEAKTICMGCAVIDACREWAIDTDEKSGTWGGMTRSERVRLKKNRETLV